MPQIIIIAGPNGAGKSTAAPFLLRPEFTFINADEVAKGLTGPPSGQQDVKASRIALRQMDDLERHRADFAVETTLASRSLALRVRRLRAVGYRFHLLFLWLPAPEVAIARVADRVGRGGHHIPEETVRRRYRAGLRNFFALYRPLADVWRIYDSSRAGPPELIVRGSRHVRRVSLWEEIQEQWSHD